MVDFGLGGLTWGPGSGKRSGWAGLACTALVRSLKPLLARCSCSASVKKWPLAAAGKIAEGDTHYFGRESMLNCQQSSLKMSEFALALALAEVCQTFPKKQLCKVKQAIMVTTCGLIS